MNIEKNRQIDSRPNIKVLLYHRIVSDEHRSRTSWPIVCVSQLRKQLELLDRWGFSCITFEDYSLIAKGELSLPKKPVILTFDDGYEDIYTSAFPLLRDFGAKATVFVLGDQSIKTNRWDVQPGLAFAPLMNAIEIKELRKAGFEIGSHSLSHVNLSKLSFDKALVEIFCSKELLEDLIQEPVQTFAYPFGAANYNLKSMVAESGYHYACGVFSGPAKFGSDRFDVRRITIFNNTSPAEFALKMLTPYEYYAWMRWEIKQKFTSSSSPRKLHNVIDSEKNHKVPIILGKEV